MAKMSLFELLDSPKLISRDRKILKFLLCSRISKQHDTSVIFLQSSRTVPNGQSIELRRLTASAEGPVEHIQVVTQPHWTSPHASHQFSSSRLALNGSQPCLMVSDSTAGVVDHDHGGGYDHHYYRGHQQPHQQPQFGGPPQGNATN